MAFYLGSNKIASGGSGTTGTASETAISDLKINYLTEEQYNAAKTEGTINENELYCTPDDTGINLLDVYPIGSIYMSVNNVNPATLFGGIWQAWGSGKVPIGVNSSDSDFNTVEKTGGTKTHNHTLNGGYAKHYVGSSYNYSRFKTISENWTANRSVTASGVDRYNEMSYGIELGGTADSSSNLPPFITCYMWKRTA